MPIVPEIDVSKLRLVARKVREIDPEIRKETIKGLKNLLNPYAKNIANDVNSKNVPGRMKGFTGHTGRTSWSPVKGSSYVALGGGKGAVARIEIYGSSNRAAFKIADLAGTKQEYNDGFLSNKGKPPTYLIAGQGQAMVSALDKIARLSSGGKGGRFAWSGFIKYRPMFLDDTVKALNGYAEKVGQRVIDGG